MMLLKKPYGELSGKKGILSDPIYPIFIKYSRVPINF